MIQKKTTYLTQKLSRKSIYIVLVPNERTQVEFPKCTNDIYFTYKTITFRTFQKEEHTNTHILNCSKLKICTLSFQMHTQIYHSFNTKQKC